MDVKTARQTFTSRAKMLNDFSASIEATDSSIAVRVIKRHFDKYYQQLLEAYEVLVAKEVDDLDVLAPMFSEVTNLLVSVETKAEEFDARPAPPVKVTPASGSQQGSVAVKLPLIQLGQFDGNPLDWVSFYDLFLSLVHARPNLPEAEKHYYLRSCLVGEPLTLVKHLPVDAANYEVALGLLRDRYQNARLLADTYLEQIVSLPIMPPTLEGLRTAFYNPLLESTQALQKLGLPVAEWSYLLLFIVEQKLPSRLRNQFEERSGATPGELPTFKALMTFLDEVCRRQLIAPPNLEQGRAEPTRQQRSPNAQRKAYATGRRSPPTDRIRGKVATLALEKRCTYCDKAGHELVNCYEFTLLARTARKTWARNHRACFTCLGDHYARECRNGAGCRSCGSKYHHTLLCTAGEAPRHDGARRTTQQSARAAPRARSPPRTPPVRSPPRVRTPPRCNSPVEHDRPSTSQRRTPEREGHQAYCLEPGRRPVGARYQLAQSQYEDLRYGRPSYIPKQERDSY